MLKAAVSDANAPLSEFGRLKLARFQVSTTAVIRWSRRYRAVRTHRRIDEKAKRLRTKRRVGPVQMAGRVGIPA